MTSNSSTDLQGHKACFPSFHGAAFLSATNALQDLKLIETNCSSSVHDFFSRKSCLGDKNSKHCKQSYLGDEGAFNCLNEIGDVAFMDLATFNNLTGLCKCLSMLFSGLIELFPCSQRFAVQCQKLQIVVPIPEQQQISKSLGSLLLELDIERNAPHRSK